MKITALIPMKGHSERVPNKNMKDFNGKPLYHYIAKTMLGSKYVTDIIINTDSDIIKEDVAKNFPSIKTVDRPSELVGDFVSMNKIIQHDMIQAPSDLFVQTHSTNPLLKSETVDSAFSMLIDSKGAYDSAFSVTKIQTRFYDKDCKPYNHNPAELLRTQDLEPLFEENSNFFIFSKESFEEAGEARIGKNPCMVEMDKIEALDIDEPSDFKIAEAIHKVLYS
jgi:CMP-N-acetylneuraminic acid synthetase